MKKKIKLPVLKIPQLKLPKFFKFKGINSSLKSFYYTGISSIIIILFFFISPKLVILKNSLFVKSVEVQNESKNNSEIIQNAKKCKNTKNNAQCQKA